MCAVVVSIAGGRRGQASHTPSSCFLSYCEADTRFGELSTYYDLNPVNLKFF